MESPTKPKDEITDCGQFYLDGVHWGYARGENGLDLWSLNDEVTVPSIAAASRHLRTLHSVRPSAIRVRTVPAPYEALEQPYTWDDLRPEYDRMLKLALRSLGLRPGDRDTGGMGSEYRGWLAFAREEAQRFLALTRDDRDEWENRQLADEIIMGTASVAFSMRHGKASLQFSMAVALAGLRKHMPTVLIDDVRRM